MAQGETMASDNDSVQDSAIFESLGRLIYEDEAGVEVVVDGPVARRELARRVVAHCDSLAARAVQLLTSFMRDRGKFDLNSIEVFSTKRTEDGGDFSLRFCFTADQDPHEYGYTYFDVYFSCRDHPPEPFWPYKFTVGFH
jgi:hypothetical protein